MKIGILGGAFDPPHLGHLIISQQIKEYLHLDEIWLMPVHSHPFEKKLSPVAHRLAMTQLLETETIKASDYEIKFNQSSVTIETLRLLEAERPEDEFSWIIGSDQLKDFHKWDEWKTLVTDFNIIVYPRGFGSQNVYEDVCQTFECNPLPSNITVMEGKDIVITNISSTLVRSRIQQSKSVQYIVPQEVISYIENNQLFSSPVS